jgi:beta-barrel assembly-enhancing protease
MYRQPYGYSRRRGMSGIGLRLIIALVIAGFSLMGYLGSRSKNEITGETQYVDLSPEEEIAMGLQAAPQMAQQHGGLHSDGQLREVVSAMGQQIVAKSIAAKSPYRFDFHLLADP